MKIAYLLVSIITSVSMAIAGTTGTYADNRRALFFYEEGRRAATQMQDKKAISAFEQALNLDPSMGDAHYRLGLLYGKQMQWKQAEQAFQHAISTDAHHIDAYCQLSEVYMGGMGRTADAASLLQQAIQIAPRDGYPRRLLGAAYLRQSRTDAAIDQLQQAIEFDSSCKETRYTLGMAYLQKGNSLDGGRPLGEEDNLRTNRPHFEAAILHFKSVIEQDPFHMQAYFNLGNVYHRMNRLAEARDAFQIFRKLNREGKQIEILTHFSRANPTAAKTWYQLGTLLEERRDWNAAASAFEKYIRLEPQDDSGYEKLAYLYIQLEAHEKATEMYGVLAERHPEVAVYQNGLGVVYAMMERYLQAIKAFEAAIRLSPSEPNFHLNLSKAYARAGNVTKANAEFNRYQRLMSRAARK